ncbi:glycosyl transferase family 2 [Pseudomonas dryadis]|uniref:Glycosyl transferase family 2 n=3 Tax=Pseudomonadales TaxID=72274 RepID=A0A4Q9QU23_9GAMM|nr:glycosyl transferase family 2 [Pseudomonas dryadis]TBV05427.1 glycosyl transferase family 2 [Pseudomonas dryadis]TBV18436.1 glycosyl transferase family 2 [Pseudomonas sp. FRB 230]
MTPMSQIFAVVLTYNRKDLLKRCLDAVYSQTRNCDGVIVIDNASSDGTEQMVLDLSLPNLRLYVLSANVGASGGFNAGFRLAYQAGADLVWMMDDDVIPNPDALQRLIEADELLAARNIEHAFLLSGAYTQEGLVNNAPSLDVRRNRIDYENWPATVELGVVPVCRATFVSILVPRSTLAEHGVPITSMFIWGEDTEFTLRVTRSKPGYLVGASKVLHLRQEGGGAISIRTEKNPVRIRYHRHFVRNELFIMRKYANQRRVLLTFAYQVWGMLRLLRKGELNKARVVLLGLAEGLGFSPQVESADAPLESLNVQIRCASSLVFDLQLLPSLAPVLESQPLYLPSAMAGAQ